MVKNPNGAHCTLQLSSSSNGKSKSVLCTVWVSAPGSVFGCHVVSSWGGTEGGGTAFLCSG